jgi:hypothetical protein
MESELIVQHRVREKAPLARGHIIESNHMVTCGKQSINHVAGNKSSRACDENPQIEPPT